MRRTSARGPDAAGRERVLILSAGVGAGHNSAAAAVQQACAARADIDEVQVLTSGPLDESPSVAPNSKLIIYAAQQGPRGVLAGVSTDGRIKQRLPFAGGDVREPAWGPFIE